MLLQYARCIQPGHGYVFGEGSSAGGVDKIHEEAAFLERFRMMLVMEDGENLWLARATPRAWLAQDKKISVKNSPTRFGTVGYAIVSDVDHKTIAAKVEMPSRNPPKSVFLRFRHPQPAPIKSVMVNGQPWKDFDAVTETIRLHNLGGNVKVEAVY